MGRSRWPSSVRPRSQPPRSRAPLSRAAGSVQMRVRTSADRRTGRSAAEHRLNKLMEVSCVLGVLVIGISRFQWLVYVCYISGLWRVCVL